MKYKLKHILAILGLTFSLATFLLFLFWWAYPYRTIEYFAPATVINKTVKAGSLVHYQIDYCKYIKQSEVVDRQFVDGIIYAVPTVKPYLPKGCAVKIQTLVVPENLPPSVYRLKIYVTYQVNPIRWITHEFETDRFNVIE